MDDEIELDIETFDRTINDVKDSELRTALLIIRKYVNVESGSDDLNEINWGIGDTGGFNYSLIIGIARW